MINWTLTPVAQQHVDRGNATREDMLGFLEFMLSEHSEDDAVTQLDRNYQHGGGWRDFKGFRYDPASNSLCYPDDPPMRAVAEAKLRDERIVLFESAWAAVIQPDGSFRVSRMD